MKKTRICIAALIAVIIATAGGAYASGSSSVTATGTVSDTCNSITAGTLAFTIDPSGTGALTPSATGTSVKCTKNSSHAVTCAATHNNLSVGNNGTTDPIPYTITGCDAASNYHVTGAGFSTAASIPLGISIAQSNYQDATAGDHTDTITITVTY